MATQGVLNKREIPGAVLSGVGEPGTNGIREREATATNHILSESVGVCAFEI